MSTTATGSSASAGDAGVASATALVAPARKGLIFGPTSGVVAPSAEGTDVLAFTTPTPPKEQC